MKSTQYTIRSIPQKLDATLRDKARKSGKSLNEIVLETLARGTGIGNKTARFHDLDWFMGSRSLDKSFDEAIKWLDSLPKEMS